MGDDVLHAWLDGTHVGEFQRDGDGRISFRYDSTMGTPISLSLPRTGRIPKTAPSAFLENLLPDDENARRRMAVRLHVDSTDTFSLLGNADTVGGLVFTRQDSLPSWPTEVRPLDDGEVARQIGYVRDNGYNWFARDLDDEFAERPTPRCRFSIAGGQPKLTLARRSGVWLWPNLSIPSTHIFKPAVRECPDSDRVEDATMTLGALCGLSVAEHELWRTDGAQAFVTRRFDRMIRDDTVHRMHCEDLAQAMGMGPNSKYDVTAASCIRFLRHYDPSEEMGYEWVRRLAFNISSADCDAHGKNYSIMLDGDSFRFAPMYDLISTRTWPHLDQELAMPINGVQYPELITPDDWKAFAKESGLEEERVVHIARTMARTVLDHVEETVGGLDSAVRDSMLKAVAKANSAIEPLNEPAPPRMSPTASTNVSGGVWVSPHMRDGHPVSGYWRSR